MHNFETKMIIILPVLVLDRFSQIPSMVPQNWLFHLEFVQPVWKM